MSEVYITTVFPLLSNAKFFRHCRSYRKPIIVRRIWGKALKLPFLWLILILPSVCQNGVYLLSLIYFQKVTVLKDVCIFGCFFFNGWMKRYHISWGKGMFLFRFCTSRKVFANRQWSYHRSKLNEIQHFG